MADIDMESIMKTVEEKVSDKSFLSEILEGREFSIICEECEKEVVISVTKDLTGICPVCGHENAITFTIG